MYTFSQSPPREDDAAVWHVQQTLLAEAERLLGKRDQAKRLCQPTFAADGPRIINTSTLDGAFARLSENAAVYWPSLVYELAHETVHLLDPVVGHTNWLEEGIAVAFSIHAQSLLGCTKVQQPASGAYFDAFQLASRLPGGAFPFAFAVRSRFGSLAGFNAGELKAAFPVVSKDLAKRLVKECIPR